MSLSPKSKFNINLNFTLSMFNQARGYLLFHIRFLYTVLCIHVGKRYILLMIKTYFQEELHNSWMVNKGQYFLLFSLCCWWDIKNHIPAFLNTYFVAVHQNWVTFIFCLSMKHGLICLICLLISYFKELKASTLLLVVLNAFGIFTIQA